METKAELQYFAFFRGFLCTANKDGSIPLGSKMVCKVTNENQALLELLLEQANNWASEWK